MAREETLRLHSDIRKEFTRLINIKEYGVQKNSTEWVIQHLSKKFYRSPKTIENIVFGRTALHKKILSQMTLF